ncbi:MAG: hypothetical protein AB1507_05450 [Bacillota bacterium]|jgi:hypothetical protein|nr:hypothetical protein [Thermoanaerobacteraceae bacterium]
MGTAEKSPPEKKSPSVLGGETPQAGGEAPEKWKAVPGYEARRFKVGARVVRALRALPWWAKALPAVVGMVLVVTLSAAKVAGSPASQGGFSDTETATMSFQAGTWGCGHGGCGGCAVGESAYGRPPEGSGGNGGCGEGDPGHQSNGGGPGGDGGGNAAGEDNGAGGGGSGGDSPGTLYDGAVENAALAAGGAGNGETDADGAAGGGETGGATQSGTADTDTDPGRAGDSGETGTTTESDAGATYDGAAENAALAGGG